MLIGSVPFATSVGGPGGFSPFVTEVVGLVGGRMGRPGGQGGGLPLPQSLSVWRPAAALLRGGSRVPRQGRWWTVWSWGRRQGGPVSFVLFFSCWLGEGGASGWEGAATPHLLWRGPQRRRRWWFSVWSLTSSRWSGASASDSGKKSSLKQQTFLGLVARVTSHTGLMSAP